MTRFLRAFIFCTIILIQSCKKDKLPATAPQPNPAPTMRYGNLQNREVKPGQPAVQLDLNLDGSMDLFFSTLLVGDPIRQADKRQFFVMSDIETNLAVNATEETPIITRQDIIPLDAFDGYQWFGLTSITLMQKVTTMNEVFWEGPWRQASSSYLAFQVKQSGTRYCGWLRLSADTTTGKIVLHDYAISLEPEKPVVAGQ